MKLHLHGKRGVDLLHDPRLNKGTAFTDAERDALGLRGLLPPRVTTQAMQVERVLGNIRRKPDDLEKYIFLVSLQERNEALFYRVVTSNLQEMMPLVYTPTVGQACQKYGAIFRRPKGLYISLEERGRIKKILQDWPESDVRMIVVTDGERILGLGDLGAHGMGIPVGKLSLYTACAGVQPDQCLPVMLDVGRTMKRSRRSAIHRIDATALAWAGLRRTGRGVFRGGAGSLPQGVYSVRRFRKCQRFPPAATLSGACMHIQRQHPGHCGRDAGRHLLRSADLRPPPGGQHVFVLWRGRGRHRCGQPRCRGAKSRRRIRHGSTGKVLVSGFERSRRSKPLGSGKHKIGFAHDFAPISDPLHAVETIKPSVLIGVSGTPGTFSEPIVRLMAGMNERPVIFALSNPTSRSECTAEQAYSWTDGRAIFAGGSPFPPVTVAGKTHHAGQCNNVYIFPGVGLGVILSAATRVTDEMFFAAAKTLAAQVTDEDIREGRIFPELRQIRKVSAAIAADVADFAFRRGLTKMARPDDVLAYVQSEMYEPDYPVYV